MSNKAQAKSWKVLDWGKVNRKFGTKVLIPCDNCGEESTLTVNGLPLAYAAGGLVFDIGGHAMPDKIRCPHCKSTFELGGGK